MATYESSPHLTASPDPALRAMEIRLLHTREEYHACLELQRDTWGEGFNEVIPATILKITNRIGGVTAGAFDGTGRLVGFVFGMTGIEDGELVHWSHMLAVRRELRDHGIGRRLKRLQWQVLAERGIRRIYWTFDPLVARNAHLNLNLLGAVVTDHVEDMYGDTGSELHGFGTDRFIVSWEVGTQKPASPPRPDAQAQAHGEAPVLNGLSVAERNALLRPYGREVRLEIPEDIDAVVAESGRAGAMRWRLPTREALAWALGAGCRVRGFYRDPASGRCFYVLTGPERGAKT